MDSNTLVSHFRLSLKDEVNLLIKRCVLKMKLPRLIVQNWSEEIYQGTGHLNKNTSKTEIAKNKTRRKIGI